MTTSEERVGPFRFSRPFATASLRLWMAFVGAFLAYVLYLDLTDPPLPRFQDGVYVALFVVLPIAVLVGLGLLQRTDRAQRWLVTMLFRTGLYPLVTFLAVGLVPAEIYFRLARPVDLILATDAKEYLFQNDQPGATFRYQGTLFTRPSMDSVVRLNGAGFHDVDHAPAAAEGVRRILLIGDSMIEAFQVDLAATMHRRLEASWNARPGSPPIEVIALGRSGFGQIGQRILLEEHGLAFDPDLVVCAFFLNDPDDSREEAGRLARGLDPTRDSQTIHPVVRYVAKSAIYLELDSVTYLLFKARDWASRRPAPEPAPDAGTGGVVVPPPDLEASLAGFSAIAALCEARGIDLLVLGISTYADRGLADHRARCLPAVDPGSPCEHLAGADELGLRYDLAAMGGLDRLGIASLFLMEVLPGQPEEFAALAADPDHLVFAGDHHFNERGHAVAARALEEYLRRANWP